MYFVEGYVSSPELLDRLWRETMSNLHGPERTNEVAFELANEKLANFLFACPWAALVGEKERGEIRVGAHYLGDFSEDAFQHRRFNPITGEVYDFERPRVIRKVKQFRRKTFLRLLPTSILCAFIIFAVTGFTARGLSLETGRALLASPHLLTLILYSLITAQLLVSLSYCGFMAWHEKRVRRAKFKGHFVMFREDVVEATLNQISAEQLEDCIDDGLSDHFPRENTPNKGGRPSTKRKRMAKAYNSLFQNGHGDTSQLVVLQKVNQLAGTNGSVYTLKRAIEEVEAARERSKTIEK